MLRLWAAAGLAVAFVAAVTVQCIHWYRFRADCADLSTALRVVRHSPSDTSLEVVFRLSPAGTPMPFLLDTGFSGSTVINSTALLARDGDPGSWDGGDPTARDRMIGRVTRAPGRRRVRALMQRNGIEYRRSTVRTVSALSGTETTRSAVGSVAFGTARGTLRRSGALVDYIPHTPSILTLDDMVCLRPCLVDTVAGRMTTQASVPAGTATPLQRFGRTGVITFAVDVGGKTLDLIADTGYGGAIAVNESVADRVLASDCDLLQATVSQVDVHSRSVCASVFLAPVSVHFEGVDAPVALGGSVPVYINESNVLGADGLIGMAAMERFAPLVITASAYLATPRILMQGRPSRVDWDATALHLEAPMLAGDGHASCTPRRERPTTCDRPGVRQRP